MTFNKLKFIFSSLAFLFLSANALTISSDTYLRNSDISGQSITVNKNALLALLQDNEVTFSSDINVYGSLYVGDTNTDDTTLTIVHSGNSITNDGLMSMNGKNVSGAISYAFSGTSITNNGKWYMIGPGVEGNSYMINPTTSITNNGLIYVSQPSNSNWKSVFKIQPSTGVTINNAGTIYVENTVFYFMGTVSGGGSVILGDNAQYFHPEDSTAPGYVRDQTIYMTSSSSVIFFPTQSTTDYIKGRGWGGGNILVFK